MLRHDGGRARLQRPGAPHHRDLRPGYRRAGDPHARRWRPQGLDRQRGARRSSGHRLRPAPRRGPHPRRARGPGPDPGRRRPSAPGRHGRGLRREGGLERCRQRSPRLRPGEGPAGQPPGPPRSRYGGGRLRESDPEPWPSVLHHAGRARGGSGEHCRRFGERRQDGPHHSDPLQRPPPAVRPCRPRRNPRTRLPRAPAHPAAPIGHDLWSPFRGPGSDPSLRRCRPHPGAGDRSAGRRAEGCRLPTRRRHHPSLPGGVRRRRISCRQPLR